MTPFSVEDKEQQAWKPKLEFDTFVDRKQRDEYVESTLPKKGSRDEQPSVSVMPRLPEELQTSPGSRTWKVRYRIRSLSSYHIASSASFCRVKMGCVCSPPSVPDWPHLQVVFLHLSGTDALLFLAKLDLSYITECTTMRRPLLHGAPDLGKTSTAGICRPL